MDKNSLRVRADDWMHANMDRFSLFGMQGQRFWRAGARSPMVLASAQKIYTLYGVMRLAANDIKFLNTEIEIQSLNQFYRPGTDAGAHQRSLLADGLSMDSINKKVRVTRAIVYMMRYSSNAAADVLASEIGKRLVASPHGHGIFQPPLIDEQIEQSFKVGDSAWYRNTTKNLTETLRQLDELQLNVDNLRTELYLPVLQRSKSAEIRGKLGSIPGYRAGAAVMNSPDGLKIYGSYAFQYPHHATALAVAIEQRLKSISLKPECDQHLVQFGTR
ncbi:MAG: hypothetical protein HLX51_00855 [Micrococcaceae bacterium]|nr:hypothetical protein [Micrococcaceae bacterium]